MKSYGVGPFVWASIISQALAGSSVGQNGLSPPTHSADQLPRPTSPFCSYRHQRTWTTQDGLPQNTVTSIVQGEDGFLWLGTFGGLARFDGFGFDAYTIRGTPELGGSFITCLFLSRDGAIWIGTGATVPNAPAAFSAHV